ncbi:MAG: transposase [Desulfuromonas sp.]|nr:MAG: transposase [Desulfuromonas sp.]
MPRTSRAVAVGYPHHVTQRGNNREPVFFDDQDRLKYIAFLKEYCSQYEIDLWAYCLMTNHIHLLAVPRTPEGLGRGIGLVNQQYTRYINRRYFRSGRVWQNRFHSCIVDTDEHLWAVARYIENNPVNAGMVTNACEYRWSSARFHLGGEADTLLERSEWLGLNDVDAYQAFMQEDDMKLTTVIKQATRSGRPLCGHETLLRLEAQLGRSL